jgi:hypothetical protein
MPIGCEAGGEVRGNGISLEVLVSSNAEPTTSLSSEEKLVTFLDKGLLCLELSGS